MALLLNQNQKNGDISSPTQKIRDFLYGFKPLAPADLSNENFPGPR